MAAARNTCEELSGLCEAARDPEGETVRIVCKGLLLSSYMLFYTKENLI